MSFAFNPLRKGKLHYTYAAGVLTVAAVGKTLVELPSATAGLSVVLDITGRSWTFTDGTVAGHSYLPDMWCGIYDVDWGSDATNCMIWYDYLVNMDNTAANVAMGMSRHSTYNTVPAHANCCWFDDVTGGAANTYAGQGAFCFWKNHAAGDGAQPCTWIGTHRMIYDKAGHDTWEVLALGANDGFGKTNEETWLLLPLNQNTMNTGKYFWSAGTPPTFTQNEPYYSMGMDGFCDIQYCFNGNTATDGSGANNMYAVFPYYTPAAPIEQKFSGRLDINANEYLFMCAIAAGDVKSGCYYDSAATQFQTLNCNDFGDTARWLSIWGRYRVC